MDSVGCELVDDVQLMDESLPLPDPMLLMATHLTKWRQPFSKSPDLRGCYWIRDGTVLWTSGGEPLEWIHAHIDANARPAWENPLMGVEEHERNLMILMDQQELEDKRLYEAKLQYETQVLKAGVKKATHTRVRKPGVLGKTKDKGIQDSMDNYGFVPL